MQPGNRTGTPNYMAPEVVRRKPTDQRLDIFAFGVSMYELFAFELPWQRGSGRPAAMGHGQSKPPPLEKYYPKINPTLRDVIHKCMEAEAEKPLPVDEASAQRHQRSSTKTRRKKYVRCSMSDCKYAAGFVLQHSRISNLTSSILDILRLLMVLALGEIPMALRVVLAAVLSAVAMFFWGFVFWGPVLNMTAQLMVAAAGRRRARRPRPARGAPDARRHVRLSRARCRLNDDEATASWEKKLDEGPLFHLAFHQHRRLADGPGDVRQGACPQLRRRPARRACCWRWSPEPCPATPAASASWSAGQPDRRRVDQRRQRHLVVPHAKYAAGQMAYMLVARPAHGPDHRRHRSSRAATNVAAGSQPAGAPDTPAQSAAIPGDLSGR